MNFVRSSENFQKSSANLGKMFGNLREIGKIFSKVLWIRIFSSRVQVDIDLNTRR